MILLIDADPLIYKACFSTEYKTYTLLDGNQFRRQKDLSSYLVTNYDEEDIIQLKETLKVSTVVESLSYTYHNLNTLIESIFAQTFSKLTGYKFFLSGDNNWRYGVEYPIKYKGNRPSKPVHIKEVTSYIKEKFPCFIEDRYEADDLIGIEATKLGAGNCIIATIDKDLKQIPGNHYNYDTRTWFEVTEAEGIRYFWQQMLTGDATDNIKGIKGIGPVTANSLLNSSPDHETTVKREYDRFFKDSSELMFDSNKKLLGILKYELPHN